MCGERVVADVDGDHRAAAAAVQPPAAAPLRDSSHGRGGGKEVVALDDDDDDEDEEEEEEEEEEDEEEEKKEHAELEEEFQRYCGSSRRRAPSAPTGDGAKKERGITRAIKDELAAAGGGGNAAGRRRPASQHGFRGVHRRTYGRWSAEIRDPVQGCRVWLGTHDTAEEAAMAYDAAARRIYGPNARTNLPAPAAEPAPEQAETKKQQAEANKKAKKKKKNKPPPPEPAAPEIVAAPDAGDQPAGEVGPAVAALEFLTEGWQFEAYGGLLGGADQMAAYSSYCDEETTTDAELLMHGGAPTHAADGWLWSSSF